MFHAMLQRLILIVWIDPSTKHARSKRTHASTLSHAPLCDRRSIHLYMNIQVSKLLRVFRKQWVPTPRVFTNQRETLDH